MGLAGVGPRDDADRHAARGVIGQQQRQLAAPVCGGAVRAGQVPPRQVRPAAERVQTRPMQRQKRQQHMLGVPAQHPARGAYGSDADGNYSATSSMHRGSLSQRAYKRGGTRCGPRFAQSVQVEQDTWEQA